ncbi:MAG: methyl-accepting chemotaxis protein [Hyphomicrobiales bacterium]|nr:MAG: methyl-accepting chemotaxis protein [Hyphomicrobiales bacterium]
MRLRFLRALTLKQRVFGFMALVSLVPIGCLGAIAYDRQQAQGIEAAALVASKGALRLAQIEAQIYATVMDARGISMARSGAEASRYIQGLDGHLGKLNGLIIDWQAAAQAGERAHLATLSAAVNEFIATQRRVLQAGRTGDLDTARDIGVSIESAPSRPAINASLQELTKLFVDQEHDAQRKRDVLSEASFTLFSAMIALSVLIGTIGAYLVHRTVIKLFNRMCAVMVDLAAGNLNVNFTGVERTDEIGVFARAFKAFKDDAALKLRLQVEAEAQRKANDAEREAAAHSQAALNARQSALIGALSESLARLREGDLTVRIAQELSPEFQALKSDFNATMDRLQNALRLVNANSAALAREAQQISGAVEELSGRTEKQAASLQETTAAFEQITATVQKTARGAAHAREVVRDATQDAAHAAEIVTQAVSAVSDIERSAQEISKIIGVIDEIAFQTNLLALNAGVEAARAGEAGRGFAVVASEVRGLAQRSAEAAKEIKGLIHASSAQVKKGVVLVGDTGTSLTRILDRVTKVNSVVGEIAAGAAEQATGFGEVNAAINQVDQVTQRNAGMVGETTAVSRSLTEKASAMMDLMAGFRFGGTTVSRSEAAA